MGACKMFGTPYSKRVGALNAFELCIAEYLPALPVGAWHVADLGYRRFSGYDAHACRIWSGRYSRRFTIPWVEKDAMAMAALWDEKATEIRAWARRHPALASQAKQLAYFRRRYGPHITADDIAQIGGI